MAQVAKMHIPIRGSNLTLLALGVVRRLRTLLAVTFGVIQVRLGFDPEAACAFWPQKDIWKSTQESNSYIMSQDLPVVPGADPRLGRGSHPLGGMGVRLEKLRNDSSTKGRIISEEEK